MTAAVEYFKSRPPGKQTQQEGELGWTPQSPYHGEKLLPWLLVAVRRVRNNLFHGGKFPGLRISDPSRGRELISNAIVILDACLILDPSVRRKFLEGLED